MKMKLLDLQTGKYLELGENWGYFGNQILIISNEDECNEDEELSVEEWLDAIEYDEIEKHDYNMLDIKHHTNPIINQIAEKVGGVIYGGRYVLIEFKQFCDEELRKIVDIVTEGLVVCDRVWDAWNVGTMSRDDFRQFDDGLCEDVSEDKVNDLKNAINKQYMVLKIFEKFAKKEQGLENKFDELQSEIMI